jgi:hypothetical protein
MSKIQDLYDTRVRPMLPAERLQLARLILDDLAPADEAVDVSDKWRDDNLVGGSARIRSPRLAHSEQSKDFAKQVVELAADAKL